MPEIKKKKPAIVLAIAPQPFFSYRGTPFSVYYRTMMMAREGVEIDLLTYGEGLDVDLPGVRVIRIPKLPFTGSIPIGPSLLKLFLDQFILLWMLALLCRRRYDAVHAHEEAVFFSAFLKPLFRYKLIYDMHSCLPQQLNNFGFTKSKIITGIFAWLEGYALRKSDALITICPDLSHYVERLNIEVKYNVLIENSIFEPIVLKENQPQSDTVLQPNFEPLTDRKYVLYAGTLESYQGIDLLIKGFSSVIKHDDQALLVIVGGSTRQVENLRAMAEAEGLSGNCIVRPRESQSIVQALIRGAAVLVSPRSRGTNTPLKIYEQIASGIPLVATDIYSHTQVLNQQVAYLVKPTPEDLARGIIHALHDGVSGNPRALAAAELYQEKYAPSIYKKKIQTLLGVLNLCAG